eukprot:scaffold2438_cov69-Phaeocystis_antarctica.AAC.8
MFIGDKLSPLTGSASPRSSVRGRMSSTSSLPRGLCTLLLPAAFTGHEGTRGVSSGCSILRLRGDSCSAHRSGRAAWCSVAAPENIEPADDPACPEVTCCCLTSGGWGVRSRFRLRGSGDESCSSMKEPEPRERGGGIIEGS